MHVRAETEKTTFSCKDDCTLTKHTRRWTYSALRYFLHLFCCQGLLVALQNASPKSLVVVFTDNGSKDLNLESEIIRLRKAKECEVFIVLTPAYEGKFNGPSLPSYGRMGKVFLINEVGADSFLRDVEVFEETNCI